MSYRDTLGTLGDTTAAKVQALVAAWRAGDLDHDTAVAMIAAVIAAANSTATALADLAVAADLTIATGTAVPALGIVPPSTDTTRLTHAARTLLDVLNDTPDPDARVARLGRSEPLTRAQDARGEALARSPLVDGWRRSVTGTCQLCTWWARDGRVWPTDHRMPTHKGCRCTQTLVLTTR